MIVYIVFDSNTGQPLDEFVSLDQLADFLKSLEEVNVRIEQQIL